MLPEAVLEKLEYFDDEKYTLKNDEIILKEKADNGRVLLKCILNKDTLILQKPENNTLPYLDGAKKNVTACADKFLFEQDSDGKWILHIMEFKKIIKIETLKKYKIQFVMGIYNARAIAGFLNIPIKEIYIYSAYRDDRIESMQDESLISMRQANLNPKDVKVINDWKKGRCCLKLDLEEKTYEHRKIQLDQAGNGTCVLGQ